MRVERTLMRIFFFQAEDGIRDIGVLEFRRVLFRSRRITTEGASPNRRKRMSRVSSSVRSAETAVDLSGGNLTLVTIVGVIALVALAMAVVFRKQVLDRKSTRLNSSHANISYAVFCL